MNAGLLVRVSTKRQSVFGVSAEDQKRRGSEWAERTGAEIVKTYERVGSGGKKWAQRFDLQEIVQDAQGGAIDVLVAPQVDRVSREVHVFWRLDGELSDADVGLVVLGFGDLVFDTGTAMGRQMLGNYLHQADVEREFISRRAKEAHEARKLQGLDVGYKQPAVGFKGSGVIDPSEQWLVERIFNEAFEGRSDRQIADGLAADGIKDRYGAEITRHRIGDMVQQPRFAGYVKLADDTHVDAAWPPLVDREKWRQIQKDRTRRRTRPAKGAGGRVAAKHLFSGNGPDLICARDGKRFHARSDRSNYVCGEKDKGWKHCESPNPKQPYLDMVIVRKLLEEVIDLEQSVDEFVERSMSLADDVRDEVVRADRTLAQIEVSLQRIEWLAESDDPRDREDYRCRRDSLHDQRQATVAQLEQLHGRLAAVESARDDEGARERAVEFLMDFGAQIRTGVADPDDIERMRVVAARLIDHVLVHPADWEPADGVLDGDLTFGDYVLEIVWRDEVSPASGQNLSPNRTYALSLDTADYASTGRRRNRLSRLALMQALREGAR